MRFQTHATARGSCKLQHKSRCYDSKRRHTHRQTDKAAWVGHVSSVPRRTCSRQPGSWSPVTSTSTGENGGYGWWSPFCNDNGRTQVNDGYDWWSPFCNDNDRTRVNGGYGWWSPFCNDSSRTRVIPGTTLGNGRARHDGQPRTPVQTVTQECSGSGRNRSIAEINGFGR